MYKLFVLFTVILCTSLTLNAQNSKEEYEKAVDYCACKIAYAYTNQYISNGKAENYNQNEFNREKKSFESKIKQILEDCKIEEQIAFDNLKTSLSNNNFSGFATKLEIVVKESKKVNIDNITKKQAINNILNGFYSNENFNKIVLKYSAVKELKSSLKTDLNNILKNFKAQTSSVEENKTTRTTESNLINETKNSNSKSNREDSGQAENSFFPNWLLFALIILSFFILFIYNHLGNKKLNERIDRRLSKSEYEQNINQLKDYNSRFERDIKERISRTEKIRNIQEENLLLKPMQQPTQIKQKDVLRIMYAKAPNKKGEFKSSDINENKDSKFYMFTLINNNEAQFEFYNTLNNVINAVDSPDVYLSSVTDSENGLNQNAKRIITNKPGIAIKQDEKWIVKEKAQITYE